MARGGAFLRRPPRREGEPIGDLLVIQVAQELVACVMDVTHRAPKEYRFDYSARMRSYAFDVLEYIFTANGLYIGPGCLPQDVQLRRSLQQQAITRAKLLAYVAQIATAQNVILPKHFAQIGKLTTSCQRLVGGWITSDRKRVPPSSPGVQRPAAPPLVPPGPSPAGDSRGDEEHEEGGTGGA